MLKFIFPEKNDGTECRIAADTCISFVENMYVLYIDILKLMMLIDTAVIVYYFAPVCSKSCARIVTKSRIFCRCSCH